MARTCSHVRALSLHAQFRHPVHSARTWRHVRAAVLGESRPPLRHIFTQTCVQSPHAHQKRPPPPQIRPPLPPERPSDQQERPSRPQRRPPEPRGRTLTSHGRPPQQDRRRFQDHRRHLRQQTVPQTVRPSPPCHQCRCFERMPITLRVLSANALPTPATTSTPLDGMGAPIK